MENIAEGATKTAIREVVPQHVVPAVENIEAIETDELEVQTPEQIGAIVKEHNNEKETKQIEIIPTYVWPTTENHPADSTRSFIERKPSTDWAKKAVILPPKFETAKIQKTQVHFNEKKTNTQTSATNKSASTESTGPTSALSTTSSKLGQKEDKSVLRKSILNMAKDDTKKANASVNATNKSVSTESSRPTSALSTTSSFSGQKEDKPVLQKSILNMAKDDTKKANASVNATNKSVSTESSRPTSALSTTSSFSGQKVSKK
ncbi:unnamed protein product [Acanthocheilonema viteae]|uniref:Uncharacterized protein n=1 Tax=Acanthocheilonema viteae TaxID=6277 RepID=A0A498SSH1_ACAVI|nr:unnamed protein product [Acanthocheilonema viteae]